MAQEDVFKKLVSHCKEYGFLLDKAIQLSGKR